MKKTLMAFGLAAAICLSGCSTSQAQISRYNAGVYVRGVLDETYTGAPEDDYLKLVDHTSQEAREVFAKNLDAEYDQRLAVRFELDERYVSRTLREDFLALLDKVYQKASYTVKSTTPMENGRYCVELSVTPVTFFASAYSDGYQQLRRDFEYTHSLPTEEEALNLSDAQLRRAQEDFESAWAQTVYDYLYTRLDHITTGPAVTLLVLVSPDSQGRYTLSATDLQNVDNLILQY